MSVTLWNQWIIVVQLLSRSLAGVICSSKQWAVFWTMFLFFYVHFPEWSISTFELIHLDFKASEHLQCICDATRGDACLPPHQPVWLILCLYVPHVWGKLWTMLHCLVMIKPTVLVRFHGLNTFYTRFKAMEKTQDILKSGGKYLGQFQEHWQQSWVYLYVFCDCFSKSLHVSLFKDVWKFRRKWKHVRFTYKTVPLCGIYLGHPEVKHVDIYYLLLFY